MQEWVNYRLLAKSGPPHFLWTKFYWDTATLIHLLVDCGCFHVTMAELSRAETIQIARLKMFSVWPLTEKIASHYTTQLGLFGHLQGSAEYLDKVGEWWESGLIFYILTLGKDICRFFFLSSKVVEGVPDDVSRYWSNSYWATSFCYYAWLYTII